MSIKGKNMSFSDIIMIFCCKITLKRQKAVFFTVICKKRSPIFEGLLFCGAPRRIRTFDLPVRSRALYPLS